jgi:RHS repeat-associated protein
VVLERTEYLDQDVEALDLNEYEITAYGSQDILPTMTIEDNGLTLHLIGNAWKKLALPYSITPSTILEFDFKSSVQGDIHAIGLDTDNTPSTYISFKLYGTENYGITDFNAYAAQAPGWVHYRIPVGQYYNGDMLYLFFINDHDIPSPAASSYFSNIRIYEEEFRAARQYDGEDNLVVELTYNPDRSTTVVDGLGHESLYTFDERNTLISETDPLGEMVEKTYDDQFQISSITDANNNTTSLTWSENGMNLVGIQDALGGETSISYDDLNNPLEVIDPLGHLTSYTYDGTLLTSVTDALNGTTNYSYTTEGYLESVTDPLGNITSYTYDSHGQTTSMTDPLGNTWSYAYDNLGRLVETTDPYGRVSRSEFDDAGRLVRSIQNYDPARVQNAENQYNITTEYEYDVRGNMVAMTDTYNRTTHYEYDDAGRLLRTIDPAGNITQNSYDLAGRLISTVDPNGNATVYAYDSSDRVISVTDALGNVSQTTYNPDGSVASTIDPLGHVTSYTYDELGRVIMTTDPLGNTNLSTYDELGNVIATTDPLGNTTAYAYDAVGNLIEQTDPLGGVTQTFYDEAGRQVQTIDPLGNTTTYTYDDAGRVLTVTDALGGVTSYAYRCNGLSSDSWGMIGCESDRVSQTVNGVTTNYFLDQATRLTQVLSDGPSDYLYGLDRIAQVNGSDTEYFLTDGLGSVRQLVDSTGKVILVQSYQPYGKNVSSIGSGSTLYGFAGEMADQTGLTYLRARYYSSYLNQFIQPDTIVTDPYIPADWNQYTYTRGNPINFIDPTGHVVWGLRQGTNLRHEVIEKKYEEMFGMANIHVEYGRQVGSPLKGFSVDLIYFPRYYVPPGQSGFQFSLTTGEIYEIEPIDLAYAAMEGVVQALGYQRLLQMNSGALHGRVTDLNNTYNGQPYDWSSVAWTLGNTIPQVVYSVRNPVTNNLLLFWKQAPGLIVYIDTGNKDHLRKLATEEEWAAVRFSVVANAPAVFDDFSQELRAQAQLCYNDLDPMFWDQDYSSAHEWWEWFAETYSAEKVRLQTDPNGICETVFGCN